MEGDEDMAARDIEGERVARKLEEEGFLVAVLGYH